MATCPSCGGHLTDGHRCTPRPVILFIDRLITVVLGGTAGALLSAADGYNSISGFIVGAMITLGARELFRI
jgi:hypothetical protein